MYICIYSRKAKVVTIPIYQKKRFHLEIPQKRSIKTMDVAGYTLTLVI